MYSTFSQIRKNIKKKKIDRISFIVGLYGA